MRFASAQRAFAFAAVALACSIPRFAEAQSLYGPEGLLLHPAATTPDAGALTPSLLILPQHLSATSPGTTRTPVWISAGVDYGLRSDLEVGATVVDAARWSGHDKPSIGPFAKLQVLKETGWQPSVAVGGTAIMGGSVDTETLFAAARKRVWSSGYQNLTVDVGERYMWKLDGRRRNEALPYAGLEFGLAPNWTFIAEGSVQTHAREDVPYAFTFAFRPSNQYHVAVTLARLTPADHPLFGIGIGYALGSRR